MDLIAIRHVVVDPRAFGERVESSLPPGEMSSLQRRQRGLLRSRGATASTFAKRPSLSRLRRDISPEGREWTSSDSPRESWKDAFNHLLDHAGLHGSSRRHSISNTRWLFVLLALLIACFFVRPALATDPATGEPVPSTTTGAEPGAKSDSTLAPSALVGRFAGKVNTPMTPLRIAVEFSLAPDGTLAGSMDIPQQGTKGLPLDRITLVAPDQVRFVLKDIPGDPSFDGRVSFDQASTDKAGKVLGLKGRFTQGTLDTTFELTRGELPKTRRKQDPQKPYPYLEEDVRVSVEPSERQRGLARAAADAAEPKSFTLAGTLTRPHGDGPFPAAILITGSGPQNRDEELLDHRPFLVLADHLTRAGIMVLRCDDRGVGDSGGDFASATSDDFADDIRACVRFLHARKDVGPIGLIGHSEGGLIAPMVAADDPERVRFVVLLAGCGVRGRDLLRRQNELLAMGGGVPPALASEIGQAADKLFAEVANTGDRDRARALVARLIKVQQAAMAGQQVDAAQLDDETTDPALSAAIDAQTDAIFSPWFRRFIAYDPSEALVRVTQPVLAINGTLDLQVDADQNLGAIERCLRLAENEDVTIKRFDGLNHLLQRCAPENNGGEAGAAKSPPDYSKGTIQWYAMNPETINPAVLDLVRDWILERFPTPAAR